MLGEVVKLQSAASRKVRQPSMREVRLARAASPWPGAWKHPHQSDADRPEAERPSLEHITRSPALIIASALFGTATEDQRRATLAIVRLLDGVQPTPAGRDAVLMMEAMAGLKDATVAAAFDEACAVDRED